jgi:hypothetical protein
MIAQISCRTVRHNGRLVADDLISCCRDYSSGLARLQFSQLTKHHRGPLAGTQCVRRPAIDRLVEGGKAV